MNRYGANCDDGDDGDKGEWSYDAVETPTIAFDLGLLLLQAPGGGNDVGGHRARLFLERTEVLEKVVERPIQAHASRLLLFEASAHLARWDFQGRNVRYDLVW